MPAVDFSLLELLSSKICHDLISPIGAIHNGLEILEEMGAADNKEVLDLIAFSAQQAGAKLQAFRLTYGAGGADHTVKIEDVHKTIENIVGAEKKIVQSWDPRLDLGHGALPHGFCKVLTAVLLLGMECLPKGGTLTVAPGITVTAAGEDAALRGNSPAALALTMPLDLLEPKYIHAYMTGLLCDRYGIKIAVTADMPGRVQFQLSAA